MPPNSQPDSGKSPPNDPARKGPSRGLWLTWAWYVLMTLAMLYFWQEASHAVSSKTIPYSEFKDRLAEGQVAQCTVAQDEVTGRIDPARPLPPHATALAAGPVSRPASMPAATKVQTTPPAQDGKAFDFRTIRVEDPNLVQDLEAGGASFVGVRPSVLSQVLWSWIIPIAFISALGGSSPAA